MIVKLFGVIGPIMEGEIVKRTPAGVGGQAGLRGSIFSEVREFGTWIENVLGIAGWNTRLSVEHGRRPGQRMPPTGPIELWLRRKLGMEREQSEAVCWAVAKSIAKKGFEGKKMFEISFEQTQWMDQNGR